MARSTHRAGNPSVRSHRSPLAEALALLACVTGLMLAPAYAVPLVPEVPSTTSPAPAQTQAQAIDDTSDAGADGRIARRIEGIFAAVPALENVTVTVKEGVVSLAGTVVAAEDIARAEQIASRITGVVTVENNIQRDVSVEESFESFAGLAERFSTFVRMLPLIGAAVLVGIVIAAFGYLIAASTWIWRRLAPNGFLAELIASAFRFVFVVGGIVIALQIVGAGALLGAVLGGAGIVGIALGFAMRDTIENYVASIMLSLRQPFRANDLVMIDQFEGRVIRLTSRATILMTLDGNQLRIPNSTVFKAVIVNFTRNPERRFEFDLGIDADADPNVARRLGVAALEQLEYVLADPPPSAQLEQVGDSNIVLKFLGWIDQRETDWFKARSRAIAAVKDALEDAGFGLPEPIYRLRFDERAPLQFRNADTPEAPEPKRAPGRAAPRDLAPEQVSPDDVIADMVERERNQTGGKENDLLDSSRPVE